MAENDLFIDFYLLVTIGVLDLDLEETHDAANYNANNFVLKHVLFVFKACCWFHSEYITHHLQVLGAYIVGKPAG